MAGGPAPSHTQGAPTDPTMANIQQILVNDTIYLRDPRIAWPNRSSERRKMFQSIQNQYYQQILYGCTNPRCETPTCLSRQKRISKGPFRPYTVLSARALATHLAAQDHPERGLCSYEKITSIGSAASFGQKEFRQKKRVHGADAYTPRNPNDSCPHQASDSGHRSLSITIDQSSVHLANGQAKSQTENRSATEARDGLGFKEISQGHEPVKRDSKSFTQSLFNTASMKILQLSMHWTEYLRDMHWASTMEEDQQKHPSLGIKGQDNTMNGNTTKDHSQVCGKCSTQERSLIDVEHEQNFQSSHLVHDNSGPSSASMEATLGGACPDSCSQGEDPEKILEADQGRDKDIGLRSTLPPDRPSSWSSIRMFDPSHSAKVGKSSYSPSLSHLNSINIPALLQKMESYKYFVQSDRHRQRMGRTEDPLLHATGTRHDQAMAYRSFLSYSTQSITYVLGNVEPLLQSFFYEEPLYKMAKLVRICGLGNMVTLFRELNRIDRPPYNIFPSLWISAGNLYLPSIVRLNGSANRDVSLEAQSSTEALPSGADQESQAHSRMLETCHMAKIILAALIAALPRCDKTEWRAIRLLRASGHVLPFTMSSSSPKEYDPNGDIPNTVDVFEDEMALSLVTRLLRSLAGRHYALKSHDEYTLQQARSEIYQGYSGIFASILRYIADDQARISISPSAAAPTLQNGRLVSEFAVTEGLETMLLALIEWLRTVIMREWNGQPTVPQCSAIGGALEFLSEIFHSKYLQTEAETFYTYLLSERLDIMQMPAEWATSDTDRNSVHLLSYPFLFPPSVLVSYFRSINYAAMYKAFESSAEAEHIAGKMIFEHHNPSAPGGLRLQDRLDVAQRGFLVLEIRRGNVLLDAMNHVWRRQRRELMRPLKVRMGMDEGEEGVDHGGVQQEFFRVAIAEALNPDYGVFTTDKRSQMSWFQPFSLEPEYKYELLGLLTSLAVYNGVTLPFTFPRALYMKLLDIPVNTLEDIEDGWPQLVQGLKTLRDWPGDDVEEVFVRPYVFSFKAYGSTVDVNMTETERILDWFEQNGQTEKGKVVYKELNGLPNVAEQIKHLDQAIFPESSQSSSPPSDPPMVTSANRHAFISSYINHLTNTTISSSYTAFHRGFHTLLSRKSLSLFTPAHLKTLVEGHPHISPSDLERATTYDGGYFPLHPTIVHFWKIIHSWPQERVRKLLEFVTASDRVPVGGVERLGFVVQRNGEGGVGGRLPTSLTCFGRLLLPEYKGEGELRGALEMAVENSRGFGTP